MAIMAPSLGPSLLHSHQFHLGPIRPAARPSVIQPSLPIINLWPPLPLHPSLRLSSPMGSRRSCRGGGLPWCLPPGRAVGVCARRKLCNGLGGGLVLVETARRGSVAWPPNHRQRGPLAWMSMCSMPACSASSSTTPASTRQLHGGAGRIQRGFEARERGHQAACLTKCPGRKSIDKKDCGSQVKIIGSVSLPEVKTGRVLKLD